MRILRLGSTGREMIHARDFSLHYYGINITDNKRTMFFFGEDLVYVTNLMLASGPDVLNL